MTESNMQNQCSHKRYLQKTWRNLFLFAVLVIVVSSLLVPSIVISAVTASDSTQPAQSAKASATATTSHSADNSTSLNITIGSDTFKIDLNSETPIELPIGSIKVIDGEIVLIPESPVSISTTLPDTIFESSKYENGVLTAEDSLGRIWKYDDKLGAFRLGWEQGLSSGSGREGMVFFNGEDTVVVSRDRDPDWALELRRVKRSRTKSVHIRAEEYVLNGVTSSKRIRVDGLVEGNVISAKEVIVGSTGVINGDVISPRIRVSDGGLVTGQENVVADNIPLIQDLGESYRVNIDFSAIPIFVGLAFLLILVAVISLQVAPDSVSRASAAITAYPTTTIKTGIVSILALPFVLGILGITIVGIPLVIVLILATPVALLVGIVAYAQFSGRVALASYGVEDSTLLRKIVVGIVVLLGLWAIAFALEASQVNFLDGIGIILMIVSITFSAVAVFSGIGAVVLTRFGRREYVPNPKTKGADFPPPPIPPETGPPETGPPPPSSPPSPEPPPMPSL